MTKKSGVHVVSKKKNDVQKIVNEAVKGDATIFIGETKVRTQVEFVMLFGSNFDTVLRENEALCMSDMRVLFAVLNKMAYGNQLSIKQKSIASELSMDQSNVSKAWKKLQDVGIFIEDIHGNEFVNFDLFLKGKGRTVIEQYEVQAQMCHNVLEAKGVKTKRPFRKFYEPTEQGKNQRQMDLANAKSMTKPAQRPSGKPTRRKQKLAVNPTPAAQTDDIPF
jgi:DNA-binding MarR family transcriptional regulator